MNPQRLDVVLPGTTYPIHIGPGMLDDAAAWCGQVPSGPLLVVTNPTVAPLYLDRLLAALQAAVPGRRVHTCIVPDGEQHKSLSTLSQVFDALVEHRIPRDGGLVALGGGVIGDLTGFAAATWQRGVACVQVPTTLLAQVDSSVGGKTAVNHPGGKNLIGAFHQPSAVIADTATLATLPPREYAAGLAEVAKYGFIMDAAFIDWMETNAVQLRERDPVALAYAIRRSCECKAHLVAIDEREQGPRALLNLGHTLVTPSRRARATASTCMARPWLSARYWRPGSRSVWAGYRPPTYSACAISCRLWACQWWRQSSACSARWN